MNSFVIVSLNVLDEEKLKQYSANAGSTVNHFGGEFIAKGKPTQLHGDARFSTTVVIQFPDKESATKWYNSDDYQQLIPLRNEAMESHFQLVG